MLKLRNGSKGDSNPGSLDCESGVLSLRYRAPLANAPAPYIIAEPWADSLEFNITQFKYPTGW